MDNKIPVELLVFDFDGTLADSIPSAVLAIQMMLSELGLPYKSEAEINRHVGFGEVPLVSGAIGTKDEELLKTAMEVYFKKYLKDGIGNIKLYPHVRDMLEKLKDKIMIIMSNKKDDFINVILENHGLSGFFREVWGGDRAPCLKPDPTVLLEIIERYKVSKERVLFVGDMVVDVETGKNAGVKTCAVTYGFDGREKLAKSRPDFLIDDVLELINLVE